MAVFFIIILSLFNALSQAKGIVIEPPTNVKATVLTPRSVEITWDRPSSSNITGYFISYTTTVSYTTGGINILSAVSATSRTLTNLEENTLYTITMQNIIGRERSAASDEVSVKTYTDIPSSSPRNVMVTSVNQASLMVSWLLPLKKNINGPITGYVIQYTKLGSSDTMSVIVNNGITHTISGLVAYVSYSVIVAAMNANGTGPFSDPPVVGRSGEDIPTAPRSLMIVDINDTTVTLSWMPPDLPNGIITQYQVQFRQNDSSNFTSVETFNPYVTLNGLTSNTQYIFQVTAFTAAVCGPSSNTASALTSFAAPTNVRCTVLSPRSVEVTWDHSSLSQVTAYLISYTTTASYTSGESVTVSGGSNTSYTLTNLEENTVYVITVQATTNDTRMSVNSNEVSVRTYKDIPRSPPHNVILTSVDPASIMVIWQPPSIIDHNGPITGYVIQYTRDGSSDMMSANVNNVTTHTISGLVAYVNYSVMVAAVNGNGTGPFSNPVLSKSGQNTPSKPHSLKLVYINSSSVILQWTIPEIPNGIITQYSIQFNQADGATVTTYYDGNMLIGTIKGLSPDTMYILQLRAYTRVGAGPSNNLTAITYPGPVSNVIVHNESVTFSGLTLEWMKLNTTNTIISHYTVFYLPLWRPYGSVVAIDKRDTQIAQDEELSMNFIGNVGTLTNLHGAVTYRIQVAAVVLLNGQEATGDRSIAINITTLEGVPTAPRNFNYVDLTNTSVILIWRRPDPSNGLIIQYNVSYNVTNSQNEILYNFAIVEADKCGCIEASYTWSGIIQGEYQFSVVAFTSKGPGKAANLMVSTRPSSKTSSDNSYHDDNSDYGNEVIIVLATLLIITIFGLVISVVINAIFVVQHKQSKYQPKQSKYDVTLNGIRCGEVKQLVSRDGTSTQSTERNHVKPSEPVYDNVTIGLEPETEYENLTFAHDIKMDANPAYRTTSFVKGRK